MNNTWITILSFGVPSLVAIVIYFLQRNKKRLSYEILRNSLIISDSQKKLDDIEITYKNVSVSNIAIAEIAIINNGNGAICKSDYENNIIINIPDNEILSAEVDLCSPKSLKPEIIVQSKWVLVKPVLLNRNDLFVVKLLLNKTYLSKLDIEIRIKDVKEVLEYSANKMSSRFRIIGILFWGISLIGLFTIGYYDFLNLKSSALIYTFTLGSIIGMILYAYGESLKFKLSRKVNSLRKKQTSS